MPDLATHILVPIIGARFIDYFRGRCRFQNTSVYLFIFGSILPDLIDKAIPTGISFASLLILKEKENYFHLNYLHSPLMLVFCTYIFSFIFRADFRKQAFIILLSGVSLHLFLDLLQGNICNYGYLWFFPYSMERPGVINFFYDDRTTMFVPYLFILFVFMEILTRFIKQNNH